MANEVWLPVVGHEGAYEVSSEGEVRSLDRTTVGPTGRRCWYRGRQLRGPTNAAGYRVYEIAGKKRYGHQLALEAFVGPRPEGYQACHGDGNPANNALSNLRWDTVSANKYDAVKHGTHGSVRVTHCPYGHRYAGANVRPQHGGRGRVCVACARARGRIRSNPELRGDHQRVSDICYTEFAEGEASGKSK